MLQHDLIRNFVSVKENRLYILFMLTAFLTVCVHAQKAEITKTLPSGGAVLPVEISNTDTVFLATLPSINVFPRQQYANSSKEQFYWRTVRDVKKALPLSKIVGREMAETNKILYGLPDDKARKAYLSEFEKRLFADYEPILRQMTTSQGRILIKLIDRECQQSSYDIIRIYKGGFAAFFWQGVARLFKADLKAEYDPENEDRAIEQIIELIEAGQL